MTGIILPPPDFVVSATQISTFELCPRKWALRWLEGVESPPNKYALLGIETHGHLENWLRQSLVPGSDEKGAELARALIPYLPPPQIVDPQNVELDQYYNLCGVKFNLKVDLFMPKWGEAPRVFDHKSCGDLKWALASDQLASDVQASLYGGWALHKTQASFVDLQWNYVRTKGAVTVLPVVARVRGRDIQERLGKSLESARKMRVIAESGVRGMDVPFDARGCSAFGGCPHQQRCNLSPHQRLVSIVAQATASERKGSNMGTEDFLAQLAAGKANGSQQQPTQAPMQQQPVNFAAQAPAQQPMNFAAQAPAQPAINFAAGQQPQAQFLSPPQAVQPGAQLPMGGFEQATAFAPTPAPKAGPGRPPKVKVTKDPWVEFASAALSPLVTMQVQPAQAAQAAAQYADALKVEFERR